MAGPAGLNNYFSSVSLTERAVNTRESILPLIFEYQQVKAVDLKTDIYRYPNGVQIANKSIKNMSLNLYIFLIPQNLTNGF